MCMKALIEELNDDLLYEMGNLSKSTTNLPMVVWIQVKNPTRHDIPQMKFANNTSDSLLPNELVSISLSDDPQILSTDVALKISSSDFNKLLQWIDKNKESLLRVWEGEISMCDFCGEMSKQ